MSRFATLQKLLDRLAQTTVPGCACTVIQNGEVLFEGCAGYADIATGKPVTPNSMFRHASTTKLFTYAITMMLYEEGAFLLSDPLYEYLPEWRNTQKFMVSGNGTVSTAPLENPITIRDAVTMACGLPYCMGVIEHTNQPTLRAMSAAIAPLLAKGTPTLRDEVRAMAAAPVMFEPGTRWQYGFGSEITGALLEEVTGKPLRVLFRERLIEPLGLKNTETFFVGDMRQQLVTSYRRTPERVFEAMPAEADAAQDAALTPEGARPHLMSSITDFAVFMQMLANGGVHKGQRLLGSGTIDLMRQNHLNADQLRDFHNNYLAGYGYGLGVRVLMDKAAGQHNGSLGAFGWTGGAGTWAEADPAQGLSIVYGHNMMPNDEAYVHLRVRAAAYGAFE